MCFQCGGMWPWAHPVQLAPPPVKEEVIYLDENPGFYADTRESHKQLPATASPSQTFYISTSTPVVMSAYAYYVYGQSYPTTSSTSGRIIYENTADWPKTHRYNPNNPQGIHPPGQVWTSNQPASQQYQYYHYPSGPAYYYNGQYGPFQMPAGTSNPIHCYYYQPQPPYIPTYYSFASPHSSDLFNGRFQNFYTAHYQRFYKLYHSSHIPLAAYAPYKNPYSFMPYLVPGGPSTIPMPTCPASMSAQAAAALATNAALAAMPQAPSYFVGTNPADAAAQQAIIAGMMGYEVKPSPTQLAPYKPADGQQFWCKEVDGSWTLRTHTDIVMGEVSPGHWERHASSGYFYWVRHVT